MGDNQQKKIIESEMDRFEREISSLVPPPATAFIPAQLRRPASQTSAAGTASSVVKPSPIIISGAPQVYNASGKIKPSVDGLGIEKSSIGKPKLTSSESESSTSVTTLIQKAPSTSVISSLGSSNSPSGNSTTGTAAPSSQSSMDISVKASTSTSIEPNLDTVEKKKKKKKKKKDDKDKKPRKALRSAGGQVWEDPTLQDWDPSGFRLFCGDLGNDVTDEVLTRVFGRYPSFQKAKVVRDKRSNKTKGFGFVSFKDPNDFVRAIKELDGRYVGSRPIKLRKSNWRNRNLDQARKKEKERTSLLTLIKK